VGGIHVFARLVRRHIKQTLNVCLCVYIYTHMLHLHIYINTFVTSVFHLKKLLCAEKGYSTSKSKSLE